MRAVRSEANIVPIRSANAYTRFPAPALSSSGRCEHVYKSITIERRMEEGFFPVRHQRNPVHKRFTFPVELTKDQKELLEKLSIEL